MLLELKKTLVRGRACMREFESVCITQRKGRSISESDEGWVKRILQLNLIHSLY